MQKLILGLDHIAIIVSSEESVDFYKHLGFEEKERHDRGCDTRVLLRGYTSHPVLGLHGTGMGSRVRHNPPAVIFSIGRGHSSVKHSISTENR